MLLSYAIGLWYLYMCFYGCSCWMVRALLIEKHDDNGEDAYRDSMILMGFLVSIVDIAMTCYSDIVSLLGDGNIVPRPWFMQDGVICALARAYAMDYHCKHYSCYSSKHVIYGILKVAKTLEEDNY